MAKTGALTAARQKLEAYGIELLCERVADITPQRQIAAEIGVSWATMRDWINGDPARLERYMRAREAQADRMVDDILGIADEPARDAADAHMRRLRIDARKWLAAKMAPKSYGEKLELAGDAANPLAFAVIERRIVDAAAPAIETGDAAAD